MVRLDAVQDLGLGLRDRLVGHRQLLDVVDPVRQRVVVGLGRPDPQHVQDDLGVLGVVLVPAVVQRLAGAGEGDGGDQPDVEAGLHQAPSQRAVVVPGRLEADGDRARQGLQLGYQPVVLGAAVGDRQPPTAPGNANWSLGLEVAKLKCEAWRRDYNEVRPHSSFGHRAPVELAEAAGRGNPP